MKRIGLTIAVVCAAAAGRASALDLPLATYITPSRAMWPSIEQGDILGADTLKGLCGLTHPHRGDVIVFLRQGSTPYISRVTGEPGQTVRVHGGHLIVDGRPVAETVVGSANGDYGGVGQLIRETIEKGVSYTTLHMNTEPALDEFGPMRLGTDQWFVMGDNRDNSADSRVMGPTPTSAICGVITSILSSKEKSHVGHKP